jgi:L-ascorbate metabolism protein UlaG (beta-lactamase superfamily)
MKMILLTSAIIIIFFTLLSLSACPALGTKPTKSDKSRFEGSKQFRREKGVFVNRIENLLKKVSEKNDSKSLFFEFLFGSKDDKPDKGLPVIKPDLTKFLEKSSDIKVIWFGHSSFLINLNGKIILVDPVISDYASPVPFVMQRFQKPPLALEECPKVDYIVISHDHYDHLDMEAVKFYKDKSTKFIVPLGVGSHLKGWGISQSRIHELDWWQSIEFDELEFIATPAQHFSGRSFNDKNSTLWAGWVLKSNNQRIFYSGDSGYDTHFKEIGKKYGPFDLTFIDNGQYNIKWEEVHLLPEQVTQAFFDLNAKALFPVHWGGFKLSTHTWYEPIQKVHQSSIKNNFKIIAPMIGEIATINDKFETNNW